MSTIETHRDWTSISDQKLDSKYEKCRNITEEIYKRINITFQIKKLEAGQSELSDNSDEIDSNELSNETDLFACDKSDITSSTEAEKPPTDCGKFINFNNNEEKNKPAPAPTKRPKKRFRKRVKKRPVRARSDSEGSSDEAPLSRIADAPCPTLTPSAEAQTANTVPKPKLEKKPTKKEGTKKAAKAHQKKQPAETIDKRNTDLSSKLSVRIEKLPIEETLSMKDDKLSIKNYRAFMKDNKLTIKNDTPSTKSDKAKDACLKDDKYSKTDKLSLKTDKLSLKADKLSMKEEKERKNCSLCSMSFRGERGLRRHMSMSHLIHAEDCK